MDFVKADDPRIGDMLAREGVVFIDRFFDAEKVAEIRRQLRRYIDDVLPTVPRAHHEYHPDGALRSMTDMHRYDPWFREFGTDPRLLDFFREAVPWDPELFYLEIFPKAPHTGPLLAHQELFATPMDPPQYLHLWVALDDVHDENAGFYFYRRSHRLGLAPHVYTKAGAGLPSVEESVLERLSPYRVQPDFPAGSAALFDGMTVHGSKANVTDRMRMALVIAVRGTATKVSDDQQIFTSIMARFFREEIGVQACDPNDRFFALGGDEAGAERVLKRIENDYHIVITAEDFRAHDTPHTLAMKLIDSKGWETVNS
ncbi:phytanoyl-CoA dioxygenase family protein [Streptomyces hiroshimensis]|uniref:Carrier domain-containing protein n=1 Tax=Streptomyces hiroshimensis TaxID=66424 RepID=A0ABQ2Y9P7_9ACTN|nr:phytanoyl-CoA dioxygenase family protein [Streptomyces hiroshimensis]GGX75632.1 hypothetical protein GCM10010324_21370 [Streptomyces hiroshimensis]